MCKGVIQNCQHFPNMNANPRCILVYRGQPFAITQGFVNRCGKGREELTHQLDQRQYIKG